MRFSAEALRSTPGLSQRQSHPPTNKPTYTDDPVWGGLAPKPHLSNVQEVVRHPSNESPPTLPQSRTELTVPPIQDDELHQAVPQTAPHPRNAYEVDPTIPPDSSSDSDNDDVEPERSYRAPNHERAFEDSLYIPPSLRQISNSVRLWSGQFAGYAQPRELGELHQSTMQISRTPWLPTGYRNLSYEQTYRHNVIGLPQESFQQPPVPHIPYDPYQSRLLNPGAPYSGLPEPQLPQSQRHIAPTQKKTNTENAGENLKKRTLWDEINSIKETDTRQKFFHALARFDSTDKMAQIAKSCGTCSAAHGLLEIALRNLKENPRAALMLLMLFLLTSYSPGEELARKFKQKFKEEPPTGPFPPELEGLWEQCLACRDEGIRRNFDPKFRDEMFDLLANHFALPTSTVLHSVPSTSEQPTALPSNSTQSLKKRPRLPSSTASQPQTNARAGFPRAHHPK